MIVYTADWVVPVTAAPIRHGAVAVTPDGRLGYVGPAAHAPDGQRRALGRSLLLPGLVNVHTHLELTAMRGLLENLAFYDWILTLTRARRQVLDRDDLFASSVAGIVEGLGAGITTYADTSASGVVADAMCAMGVRGVMYLEIFGPDPAELENALREYLPRLEAARAAETSLVRVGISPHAPYSVSTTLLRAMAELAWREGLPAAIHVAESREEMAFVRDAAGTWARSHASRGIEVVAHRCSPVELLRRSDVLSARPLMIHMVQADDDDLATIVEHDCAIAHCPVSNAKLGHGIAPLRRMLELGARVGLGSDSVASSNRMHLLEEARHAILAQRHRAPEAEPLDASRALELATIGGARVLGLENRIGSLEPGKDADLAAFPIPHYLGADADPSATLVWTLGGASAQLVAVQGNVLVSEGRIVRDAADALARVEAATTRLLEWRHASRTDSIRV